MSRIIASRRLCEELYELSGWNRTEFLWAAPPLTDDYMPIHRKELHKLNDDPVMVSSMYNSTFAYDLAYLLNRLPGTIRCREHSFWYRWRLTPLQKGYCISYQNDAWVTAHKSALKRDGFSDDYIELLQYWQSPQYGDNAADAVAKLAIELFKRGILVRKGSND